MRHRLLRWLFYTWRTLKRLVITVVLLLVAAVLVTIGLLQLDVTHRYIAHKTETSFNETFRGRLSIGDLSGLLPLHAKLTDVTITHPDTVLSIGSLSVSISLADLLSRRVRITRILIDRPDVRVGVDLTSALQRRRPGIRDGTSADDVPWTFQFPTISVLEGKVRVDSFRVDSLYLHAFAERNPTATYFDVASASFREPTLSERPIRLSGQYYQDARFLEVNALRLNFRESSLRAGLVRDNALDTVPVWRFRLDSTLVHLPDLAVLLPAMAGLDGSAWISADGQGTMNGGEIRSATVTYGASHILLGATVLYPFDQKRFFYDATVRRAHVTHTDAIRFRDLPVFPDLTVRGRMSGDLTHLNVRADVSSSKGKLTVDARSDWSRALRSNGSLSLTGVDLSGFLADAPSTSLNSRIRFQAVQDSVNAELMLSPSTLGKVRIDTLSLSVTGTTTRFRAALAANVSGSELEATLRADLTGAEPHIRVEGTGERVDIHDLLPGSPLASTDLDLRFAADLRGANAERIRGMLSVDVDRAVVGGVKVKAHQLYIDLDSPDLDTRTMRFTSNIADATVIGDIRVEQFGRMGRYWGNWLISQARRQFLLRSDTPQDERVPDPQIRDVQLAVEASLKDLRLLNLYAPQLPPLGSRSDMSFLVNATGERLLINGGIRGDSIAVGTFKAIESNLQVSAHFRYGSDLNDFSQLRMQLNAGLFRIGNFEMREYLFETVLQDDQLQITQRANRIGQSTRLRNRITATLGDSLLTVTVEEFRLSTNQYVWNSPGRPTLSLHPNGSLVIKDLLLNNDDQVIDIRGTFATNREDSVVYRIENLDLGRLSALIGGRLPFDGQLSATISTKSLTREPSVEGLIQVDGFSLSGRTIGDITFASRLNPEFDRFDTRMRIRTDSVAYREELRLTGGFGNDIQLDGYVKTSTQGSPTDTLYMMVADLRKVDMWIVELINPELFERIEGMASGRGWITGNTGWIDFDSRIQVSQARLTPTFLLTDYTASGPIRLSRKGGLSIDTLTVLDRLGGRGQVFGRLDFNDFKPEKDLNFTMVLSNLQFLNNSFTPDVPFYGTAYGTGVVTLTGKTTSPFLQTRGQMITSAASRISIPLLDETNVQEQARFIEFVQSFDEVWAPKPQVTGTGPVPVTAASSRFVELFTLNLSFAAPPGSTVQLVFDPLTGEILNARGSGSVQVRLEDQQFNVFGTFNVNQGDYTFVAGDIFVRRFDLRDGGTLVWEGPPDNARLNVLAAYRSRPDISVLNPQLLVGAGSSSVRIPVDLMLSITGTIQSIQNDFYFEFPNNLDVTQNSTELSVLNSEEQKLIQATSLLFTGGFIQTAGALEGNYSGLQAGLEQRGLSMLLSSQVNSLLSSRISNLDVDINFSGFDQADLGVALRLFDDRLVLRGESQFDQGPQGSGAQLGDVRATFRINRALSLELFHRRDPTLRFISGGSNTETINGIGLEAQYQFNTWKEFGQRVWASVRRFFGASPTTSTPAISGP